MERKTTLVTLIHSVLYTIYLYTALLHTHDHNICLSCVSRTVIALSDKVSWVNSVSLARTHNHRLPVSGRNDEVQSTECVTAPRLGLNTSATETEATPARVPITFHKCAVGPIIRLNKNANECL